MFEELMERGRFAGVAASIDFLGVFDTVASVFLGDSVAKTMPIPGRVALKDPYTEIYLCRDKWWGLIREEWLAPQNGVSIRWPEFERNIKIAAEFHKLIGGKYHPKTYAFYGADNGKGKSFGKIDWSVSKGVTPRTGKQVPTDSVFGLSGTEVRETGTNPIYVGGEAKIPEHSSMMPAQGPVPVSNTSFWEIRCSLADVPGDGTVPLVSGSAPRRSAPQRIIRQFALTGFTHEGAYRKVPPLTVTEYSITKLCALAKKLI